MAGAVATVSVGLAWLGLMAAAASATQFRVGGGRGWSVPDANAEPYNSWAGRMRFQIGDQLLFVYPKEMDAVVVVDQGAYDACNTSSSVAGGGGGRYDDGNTVFTFDRSGPFFFISGNEANCRAGEKLVVVVMADRGGRPAPPPSAVAAGCASSRRAGADAEPGVVATVACASRRHPELGAVSGSYDAEPIAVGFTYGAGACSDEVNTELATGASGHGTVAVNYPWRRGPAAAAAGDRWGERDDAGGARSQRPEWRRRRCSGGGRRRRHVAGSIHRLRHASYLKLSASAVTCSFICAV
uniref:Phytocyanin domain-containing protein n=1 Tax=Oryza rufipogon TaxID=4529 RepID=A0A0E0Q1P8_ORYRU